MSSEDAVVALSDATERLTYAALTQDPDTLKAAYEALLRADEADRDSAGPNDAVRRAVAEKDPVTAAGLGWLTMQDLGAGRERDHQVPVVAEEVANVSEVVLAGGFGGEQVAGGGVVAERGEGVPNGAGVFAGDEHFLG